MVVVVVTMGRRIKDAAVLLAVCVLLTQLLHFCFSLLLSSPLSFPFPLLRSCFRVPQDSVWGMSQDSIVQYHEQHWEMVLCADFSSSVSYHLVPRV